MQWFNLKAMFLLFFLSSSALSGALYDFQTKDCRSILDKHSVFEEFLKNPAFDGSVVIPKNLEFDINFPHSLRKAHVQSQSILQQSRDLKKLIKKIKQLSFHDQQAKEREVAAFLVTYLDGSQRAITFSSSKVNVIDGEDINKAIKLSKILENTKSVRNVINIHSHPDPKNLLKRTGLNEAGILYSELDIQFYESLKAQLNMFAKRNVPFSAMLIPNCENCDDLLFVINY